MRAFNRITAVAVPIDQRNVNTDMLFPARFLRKQRGPEYSSYLFHDLRFTPEGKVRAEFVLNQKPFRNAQILVGNANFGCGSSRETAVYALGDYGFRAIVAPSFGDIFAANCIMNGILPVRLPEDVAQDIRNQVASHPGAELTIDLQAQLVIDLHGRNHPFEIGAFEKECLLQGVDEIDLTLRYEDLIQAYERRHAFENGWLGDA